MTDVRLAALGDVCSFVGGGTPSRKNPDYFAGKIPWASVKDFKSFTINDTEEHITEQALNDSAANLVQEGTVLLVTRVGLGKVAVAGTQLAINQDIKAVIPNDEIEPEYLFWFLVSQAERLKAMGMGATVKGITLSDVKPIKIPLRSLAAQRRFVDLLTRAEGILRLRREARHKASELLPTIFLSMFGNPKDNPKGWPVGSIDELCDLVRGSSPRPQGDSRYFGGPIPRLMIADITRDGIYVKPSIDSLTLEGAAKSRPMKAGDVVMAVSGACGLPAILANDACIHDGFVGFRSLSKRITPTYLYHFLAFRREASSSEAIGATFQNLKTDQIRNWKIPIPPLDLQLAFLAKAESVSRLAQQQAQATKKAQQTFDALLNRIFDQRHSPTI